MHFYCKCGCRISDTTDYLPYKGYLVADQDWFDIWDKLNELVLSEAADREKQFDELFFSDMSRTVYQCPQCGNLYLEGEGNQLIGFAAEEGTDTHLLESRLGENWKGMLYAYWEEKTGDWNPHKGTIFVEVNGKNRNTYFYEEYEEFEKEYCRLFHELKDICLRGASLRVENARVHSWSLEEENGKKQQEG